MPALSIPRKRMEPIARWHSEVVQVRGEVNVLQLSGGPFRNVSRDPFAPAVGVKLARATVCKRPS